VRLGGALDRVTRERGQTVYCPDVRVPLHPEVLSEAAASLLPDAVRPAFVWDLRLDGAGLLTSAQVYRAMVRSVERLDYAHVQAAVDAGTDDERFLLLKEIGERRIAQERARGGASLPMPEQQVTARDGGGFTLEFRPPVAAEEWNAQVSLLTGMAAATMMLEAGVGVLRTMPAPTPEAVAWFRRVARGLGAEWPEGVPYGEFVRGLDRANPRHLALIHEATALFRGAGYTAFEGEPPAQPEHAAVAAPYAHVTAPLRRLVDRFGLVVCEAACRGADVPDAVRAALPELAGLMRDSDRRARAAERACADATEAAVLHGREGESFGAIVVDHTDKGMEVQLVDLPVIARVTGRRAALGSHLSVRLDLADVRAGEVAFSYE
jgi:exoribonuclease R